MNDAISQLQKRGKGKSKLEQLLLVDHSDIYFENERLAEKLARYLDDLQREKHLLLMLHESEKKELEEHIESLLSMKQTSSEKTRRLLDALDQLTSQHSSSIPKPEKKIRPHTTGSYFRRSKGRSEDKDRIAEEKVSAYVHSLSDNEDGDPDNRRKERQRRPPNKDNEQNVVSELKPGERKYPEDWYTTVLPANDNCLKRVRNEFRRMQTAPALLSRTRKQDEADDSMMQRSRASSRKNSTALDDDSDSDSKSRMKLVCNRKSKPIVMSLRQMKEMTNMESESDAMANRRREKMERYLKDNQKKFDALTVRMKTFIEDVEIKIAKDAEDSKPKEVEKEDMYFGIVPPDQLPL